MIHCELLAGMAELSQGHLQTALRQFDNASNSAQKTDAYSQGAVAATVYLTDVLYETNRLDDCEARLQRSLAYIAESGMPDFLIQSYRALLLISRSRRDWEGALKWADELEQLGHLREFPRVIASARLLRAELELTRGGLTQAEQLLDEAEATVDWKRYEDWRPYANDILVPAVVRLRLGLCREDYTNVITRLE